jgi:adenylate kinase
MKGLRREPAASADAAAAFEDLARIFSMSQRLCLILFGPPGSGKGTQAVLLRDKFGFAHISTGEMLRERVVLGDEVGQRVARTMKRGALVRDETVNRLVEDRIELADAAKGFILDGYPRTVQQATLLDGALQAKGIGTVVIHLKVDYNIIIARLSGRRQCPACGTVYNLPPDTPPEKQVCSKDAVGLIVRADDAPETVRERLSAYEIQTTPVLEFLKGAGYRCFDIEAGARTPREIVTEIEGRVEAEFGAAA